MLVYCHILFIHIHRFRWRFKIQFLPFCLKCIHSLSHQFYCKSSGVVEACLREYTHLLSLSHFLESLLDFFRLWKETGTQKKPTQNMQSPYKNTSSLTRISIRDVVVVRQWHYFFFSSFTDECEIAGVINDIIVPTDIISTMWITSCISVRHVTRCI